MALAALMVLGGMLRVFRLGYQSMWNDEIVTYISSFGTPWRVITQRVENSNIPPLYYLVANAALPLQRWLGTESALRLPSVIVGVLTIPLVFVVVRRWLGTATALAAAAFVAISPFHVWYSQEARPYALLVFLSLVALFCLQQALAHPTNWGWKAATAIAAVSTFYCHTIGLAFMAFVAAYAVLATTDDQFGPGWWAGVRTRGTDWRIVWRTHWRGWAITFLAMAVLCVPAVYRLVSFPPTESADSTRGVSPIQLGYALWSFAVGYSLGPSLGELHTADRHAVLSRYAATVLSVGVGVVVLTGLGVWRLLGRSGARTNGDVPEPGSAAAIGLWFAFPLVFAVGGALLTVHPFNVRYTIISFLPAVLFIVLGLEALPARALRAAAWAGVVAVSAAALAGYYFDPRYARDDNRGAAAFFTGHAAPGELVIAHRAFTAKDLRHYAPAATHVIPFPAPRPGIAPATASAQPVNGTSARAELAADVRGEPRVWLFLSRGTSEEEAPIVAYCDSTLQRTLSYVSSGVRLLGYTRDRAGPEPPPTPSVKPAAH